MKAEEAGKGLGSASLGALAGATEEATTRFLLRLDPSLKEREIMPLNAVPAALAVRFALHIVDRCAKCRQILHRVHCERGCCLRRYWADAARGSCLRREGTLWLRRRLDSDRGFRYKGSDECPLVARLHLDVFGDLYGLILSQALQRSHTVVALVINQRGCVLLETDFLEFEKDGAFRRHCAGHLLKFGAKPGS